MALAAGLSLAISLSHVITQDHTLLRQDQRLARQDSRLLREHALLCKAEADDREADARLAQRMHVRVAFPALPGC